MKKDQEHKMKPTEDPRDLLLEENTHKVDGKYFDVQFIPYSILHKLIPKPRDTILSPWLKIPELVMLCGGESVGKSRFILHMFKDISEGRDFGPWKCEKPRRCLYIDGESAFDFQKVVEEMGGISDKNFSYYNLALTEELLTNLNAQLDLPLNFLKSRMGNLAVPEWRKDCFASIYNQGFEIVAFDNLTTLCPGVDLKNEKDWSPIAADIIKLLVARGITVILTHHVTKKGDQYGNRLMKAPMNTLLYLRGLGGDQAHFTIEVDKYRAHPSEKESLKRLDIRLEGSPTEFTFSSLFVQVLEGSKKKDKIKSHLKSGMTPRQIIKTGKFAKSQVYKVAETYKVINDDYDE